MSEKLYFYDIVFDENTKDVIAVYKNDRIISNQGTNDIRKIYPTLIRDGIKLNSVSWATYVPEALLNRPTDFKVDFDNNYSKPLYVFDKINKIKYKIGLNTQIKNNKIFWFGPMLDYISYSIVTRDLSFKLLDMGYNITLCPTKPSGKIELPETDLQRIKNNLRTNEDLIDDSYLKILSFIPLYNVAHSAYTIYYTMLETFNVQEMTMDALNTSCNEVWVPTEFAAKQWRPYLNDRIRIEVMPLWVDENKFKPGIEKCDVDFTIVSENPQRYSKVPKDFKFFFVSRYSKRKGIDSLINAFLDEFDYTKDNVCLVMFCRHILNVPNSDVVVENKIRDIIKKHNNPNPPPIYLYNKPVTPEQQAGMYGWGDCFVLPTRGEGFGLPFIEAAACKIPAISPNHTGLSDFINNDVAYVINTDIVESCGKKILDYENKRFRYEGKYPDWDEWITPLYNDCQFAVMGEEAILETRKHMRGVYSKSYTDIDQRVENFYNLVKRDYTFNKCFSKIKNRIDEILEKYK